MMEAGGEPPRKLQPRLVVDCLPRCEDVKHQIMSVWLVQTGAPASPYNQTSTFLLQDSRRNTHGITQGNLLLLLLSVQ